MESILFWTTTSSVYAYDPLPDTHSLSARNLTLEILCKLCAHAENMNFLLATPPVERLRRLFQNLAKLLADTDQVGLNSISWLKVKLADYSILYIMRGFVC